ncbi:MAG: coproporphyrinogen III oxidase, partial [Polaromonas sp.]|nr:coproporphyrinogen III oxidase [Polaromonas sp.]MBP6156959.1 coproporphyrinogen III oxidase [Polaromonas sp.]MBP9830984.1 coproporphyrinogen III oxidase [Polaromonas sp.]
CQGNVLFESMELGYLINFKNYFAAEMEVLKTLQDQDLVEVDEHQIQVTEMGWFFVRAVAMVFDKYLQTDRTRAKFSKII